MSIAHSSAIADFWPLYGNVLFFEEIESVHW